MGFDDADDEDDGGDQGMMKGQQTEQKISKRTRATRSTQIAADEGDGEEKEKRSKTATSAAANEEELSVPAQREDNGNEKFYTSKNEDFETFYSKSLPLQQRDITNWEKLPKAEQNICVKAAVRFFLFNAARNNVIYRNGLYEHLGDVDASGVYHKHVSASIFYANEILQKEFGFNVVVESDIKLGGKDSGRFLLVNNLKSPRLQQILSRQSSDKEYIGFVYLVCLIIFTAANKQANVDLIYKHVRLVDERFPETTSHKTKSSSSSSSSSCAFHLPGTNYDFGELLNRMRKDGYIIEEKMERTVKQDDRTYSLGSRFLAELGHKRLVQGYYETIEEPVDTTVLDQIKKDAERLARDIESGYEK